MSFLWLLSASWGKGRGWFTGGLARIWCPCLGSSLSIWRAGALSPQTPFIPPELEILDKFWPSAHKKYTHWQHARCILFFFVSVMLWMSVVHPEDNILLLSNWNEFLPNSHILCAFSAICLAQVQAVTYLSPVVDTDTQTHTLCIFSDTGRPDTMNSCETFWIWNSTEGKQLWLSVL